MKKENYKRRGKKLVDYRRAMKLERCVSVGTGDDDDFLPDRSLVKERKSGRPKRKAPARRSQTDPMSPRMLFLEGVGVNLFLEWQEDKTATSTPEYRRALRNFFFQISD